MCEGLGHERERFDRERAFRVHVEVTAINRQRSRVTSSGIALEDFLRGLPLEIASEFTLQPIAVMRRSHVVAPALLALLLAACATPIFNRPSNVPISAATPPQMGWSSAVVGANAVALSFSGGGLRAAAFAQGVLQALASLKVDNGDLLDDVTLVSSVSGGSLTAAYFALNGSAGLESFRDQVLLRDFEGSMRLSLISPENLRRIVGGGLNDRTNFAELLDRDVFRGATFSDLYRRRRPDVWINATDLYHRTTFTFIPPIFAALCSDLGAFKVADAVAASMAVPLVFAPIVVQAFPERCADPLGSWIQMLERPAAPRLMQSVARATRDYRDPARVRYVNLVDGGVTDNYGLSSVLISRAASGTPQGPLTARDAVSIRRMLYLIVDAGRGPGGEWPLHEEGPSGLEVALSATDAAIDAAARLAIDAFIRTLREWQDAVIEFRCGLDMHEVAKLGGDPAHWNCGNVQFEADVLSFVDLDSQLRGRVEAIPTRLTLRADQIDDAIEAGRRATLASPKVQAFQAQRLADRARPASAPNSPDQTRR